ncbi:MAG: T9SS type A sorting domain-containing protein, partial [Saprospiraceae bacterium]
LEELLDAIRCVNEGYDICDEVNESLRPGKKLEPIVQQVQAVDFRIFPNPASGEITVDLSAYPDLAVRLEVYDVQGRVLQTLETNTGGTIMARLNLAAYEDGIYLIRVQAVGVENFQPARPAATKRIVLHRN